MSFDCRLFLSNSTGSYSSAAETICSQACKNWQTADERTTTDSLYFVKVSLGTVVFISMVFSEVSELAGGHGQTWALGVLAASSSFHQQLQTPVRRARVVIALLLLEEVNKKIDSMAQHSLFVSSHWFDWSTASPVKRTGGLCVVSPLSLSSSLSSSLAPSPPICQLPLSTYLCFGPLDGSSRLCLLPAEDP